MVITRGQAKEPAWVEDYRAALAVSEIGVFRWYFDSGWVEWDKTMYRLFEAPLEPPVRCLEDILALIHPPDQAKVRAVAEAAAQTQAPIEVQFRRRGPDGALYWLLGRGRVFCDSAGTPCFAAGTCQEIAVPPKEEKAASPSSEALLQHVTAALPVLISYVDGELRYQYVSAAYEKWFHRPLEEIRGQPVREVIGEAAFAVAEPYLRRALAGEPVAYTEELPYQEVGLHHVHVQLIPDGTKGQVRGLSCVVSDLTELQILSKHQAQLAALVESSTDAIISQDLDSRVQSWNPGAERLFGYTAEEMVGQPINRLIPDAFQAEAAQVVARIRQGQPVAIYETVRRRKDGTLVPVSLTASPIKDACGRLIGISRIARDLSATQQAEVTLQEKQERLSMALRASGTATYRWDIATNIIHWDESATLLFGLAVKEASRLATLTGFVELIHPEDRAAFVNAVEDCISQGSDFDLEYRIFLPGGSVRWLVDRGKMLRDQAGKPLYMTGACRDITAHKQTEAALRESERKLQEADRRKNEFLAP
jgi:PAS domain S-box-containing protein